jgi:hypothetical protein
VNIFYATRMFAVLIKISGIVMAIVKVVISTDILDPIDMLFTEMAAGEHFLCHPFFKKHPPHTSIFIFVATASGLFPAHRN